MKMLRDLLLLKVYLLTVCFVFLNGNVSAVNTSKPGSIQTHPELIKLNKLKTEESSEYGGEFLKLERRFKNEKNIQQLIDLYNVHQEYLYNLGKYDSVITTIHQVRNLKIKNSSNELDPEYLMLGALFYFKNNYDSVVFWHDKAKVSVDPKSPYYGEYLMLSALKHFFEEDYLSSIDLNLKAIEILERDNNSRKAAIIYNNLASNYNRLGNLELNEEYLLKAININKTIGTTSDLIANYNNLGANFRKKNQLAQALESYSLAYEELKKVNNPILMAQNLTNRANIFEKLEDYLSAEALFLECENISESNQIGYGLLLSNLNLGNLYRLMGNYAVSEGRLKKALELAIGLRSSREEALIYERLSWLYKDKKDFENAYQYVNRFNALNDSLINESVKKESVQLKEKYEAEKKELQIITLSKDKLNQQLYMAMMGLALLVLVVVALWWKIKHDRTVQEKLREKQQYKYQLELKEKELLADSIRRLSIMHTKEALADELKELIQDLPKTQSRKFLKVQKELLSSKDESLLHEFETRFLGVYESFFIRLKELAPDLTPTELRIAALIRLNFNSKEISVITNRSVRTIDNLRSIIRKKLCMKDEDNLLDKLYEM